MGRMVRSGGKSLDTFKTAIRDLDGMTTKVGWLGNNDYPTEASTPVAYVAAIQEYGAPSRGVPPRPHGRPTIVENQRDWKAIAGRLAVATVKGTMSAFDAMQMLGLRAEGDWRKTIASVNEPKLSPITIAIRAWKRDGNIVNGYADVMKVREMYERGEIDISGTSVKPLNDTGLMLATLTHLTTNA